MQITRKTLVATAVAAGTFAAAGASFAYWTTSGTGTGSARTGTSEAVTVHQVGTMEELVPGGLAQEIEFKIHNPANFDQYITSVDVTISKVDGGTENTAEPCAVSDFLLAGGDNVVIGRDLVPGDNAYTGASPTLALVNTTANQDNCKGAVVHLAFTAS
jgi:hypothetical protein